MSLLMRLLYAIAVGVIAWLICVFFGGFLALTNQPMLAFLGHFLETYAVLIGIIVAVLAVVGGAPGSLLAYFHRPPAPRP
jgi:fructose-specific phosphotransferase system IIC component